MAGTRTKYNPQTIERLEQAIGAGATYRLACAYAGINEDTLLRWRKSHAEIAERLARAEASAGLRWLARIEQASQIDWRAAAWKLEHRFPDEYGRVVQQLQGKDGGPISEEHITRIIVEEAPPRRLAVVHEDTIEAEVREVASP